MRRVNVPLKFRVRVNYIAEEMSISPILAFEVMIGDIGLGEG